MVRRFLNYINEHQLFGNEDRILLAVSGGIDSIVMCHLFHEASLHFGIAHCNFGLRGDESDKDEDFVREVAARYQAGFFTIRFDTRAYARENRKGIQVAARELRMRWLEETVTAGGFKCYATAHQQDDMMETFFLNLLRGTGIHGLRGIKPKNGLLIHPLLFATRAEIALYATEKGLKYREDSSNRQNYYRRNRIRHSVIPELIKIQPQLQTIMQQNMMRLEQVERIYNKQKNWIRNLLVETKEDRIIILFDKLFSLPDYGLHILPVLEEFGFNASVSRKILHLSGKQSGKKFISGSHLLFIERDHWMIMDKDQKEAGEEKYSLAEGTTEMDAPLKLAFSIVDRNSLANLKTRPEVALFDKSKLTFPLVLRRWQKGDHFYPFGSGKRKLLSDYFTDKKFTQEQKSKTWLLCSGNDIIWIIGYRSDHRYRVQDPGREILRIEWIKSI